MDKQFCEPANLYVPRPPIPFIQDYFSEATHRERNNAAGPVVSQGEGISDLAPS